MKAIKLICGENNRFRLGATDLDSLTEYIHSDTIFSAIINSVNALYGRDKSNEFVELFRKKDIKISSGFYLLEVSNGDDKKRIFFLPKIFGKIQKKDKDDKKENNQFDKKQIKKIKFISLDVFKELLNSVREEEEEVYFDYSLKELPLIGEKFAISKEEKEEIEGMGFDKLSEYKPFQSLELPKVSVSRKEVRDAGEDESKNIYYQSDVTLNSEKSKKNAGCRISTHFYFLIDSDMSRENKKVFYSSLRFLGDEGLGGKATTGAGLFNGIEELAFEWNLEGKYQTNLSLLSPIEDRLESIYSYESVSRGGGYVYLNKDTAERKRKVRMIKEGSIFKGDMRGSMVEIGEVSSTKIYQNGVNFGLNFGGDLCKSS